MKKLLFKPFTVPIALLFLTIAAYGLLSPWTGFYWDDWPFAWILHFLGPKEFVPAFAPFRPLLGPIFVLTTSILGEHPFTWQVFAMLLRFLTGLAVWWSFSKVWPNNKRQVALLSLCFVVFPGYQSQWVALTHSNQELVSLLAYLFSFGFTALAIRRPEKRLLFTIISLLLMFVGLFPTEYFLGLELLRPIFIFFMLMEDHEVKKNLVRTLKIWLPYLLLWASNGLFLYLYQSSTAYDSYGIEMFGVFDLALFKLVARIIEDIIKAIGTAGLTAWTQPLDLLTQSLTTTSNLLSIALVLIIFIIMTIYLWRLDLPSSDTESDYTTKNPWGLQAILLGIVGILMGRLPSWVAGLPLRFEFSWDRFMLSMMLGATFFFLGLLDYLIKNDHRKTILIGLVIALAVGQQFNAANRFRRDWANQQNFFWQLVWRIPGLEPNTTLATHELPLDHESGFQLTAPLNWIYSPEITTRDLPYMLIYTKARLGSSLLPAMLPDQPTQVNYRTMNFKGNTSDMVVFYHPVPGCVRVLDPLYANAETTPGMTHMLTDAIPLSDLSRIQVDSESPQPPEYLFGSEPDHNWCYYYQKADLARQSGDWSQVTDLGREAMTNGYYAILPAEWLPFIEAFALSGDIDIARDLTQQVIDQEADLSPALCTLWIRVESGIETSDIILEAIPEIKAKLECTP